MMRFQGYEQIAGSFGLEHVSFGLLDPAWYLFQDCAVKVGEIFKNGNEKRST